MSTLKVGTTTGSVYELGMEDLAMRRTSNGEGVSALRKDGDWVQMLLEPELVIGRPMYLTLAPLSEDCDVTVRTTSTVVYIEEG